MDVRTEPNGNCNVEASPLTQKLKQKLDYDELTNCMRCGFCQPACPTFRETGLEAESPRGRIALMKAVVDGLMEPDESFQAQMNHCLGCRACEPACPAGVQYGHLLEASRSAIEEEKPHRWWVRLVRNLAFRQLFPSQKRMKWLGGMLAFYQKSGLQRVARGIGILKLFPKQMRDMERILPSSSSLGVVERLGTTIPAKGERIATVGLFRGCLMDVLFTETNVNTVKLLTEAGFDVVIPTAQNCCGALHAHSGEDEQARVLARSNIRAFQEAGVDYIVSNAGGCGALMVEYDHLLHDDTEWNDAAKWFASRVKDISQIIIELGRIPQFTNEVIIADEQMKVNLIEDMKVNPQGDITITYQDSCHLRNVMKGSSAPRALMKQVGNVSFVELKESERCCGSAGIYNLTEPQMADQILQHKMDHVEKTQAHYLLTSNPGCLLQMKSGIYQRGLENQMKAVHIVDFLAEKIKA